MSVYKQFICDTLNIFIKFLYFVLDLCLWKEIEGDCD